MSSDKTCEEKDKPEEKGKTSSLTLYFLIFFLASGVFGYINGRLARCSPKQLRNTLVSVPEKYFSFAKDSGGNIVIVFKHQDKENIAQDKENIAAVYRIDTDQVDFDVSSFKLQKETIPIPRILLSTAKDVATGLSVSQLYEYLRTPSGSKQPLSVKVKKVAVAISGTIIGYEVGYELGVLSGSRCDDNASYVELLKADNEKTIWQVMLKPLWLYKYSLIKRELIPCKSGNTETDQTQNRILEQTSRGLKLIETKCKDKLSKLSSKDFEALEDLEKVQKEYTKICLGQSP